MAKRDKWEFEYKANQLLDACTAKIEHHTARLTWWADKKKETMEKVRAEGISVEESIADRDYDHQTRLSANISSGWNRDAPIVKVRGDLQRDLAEAAGKIHEHQEKLNAYKGWAEVFAAQGDRAQALQYDDWLYFFGQTSKTPEW